MEKLLNLCNCGIYKMSESMKTLQAHFSTCAEAGHAILIGKDLSVVVFL